MQHRGRRRLRPQQGDVTGHRGGDDGDVVISGDHFKAISGHRDAGSTACPGRYLYAQLPAIRRATAAAQDGKDDPDPTPTPPPPTPEPEPDPVTTTDRDADLSGRSFPDLVARDKRTGRAVVISEIPSSSRAWAVKASFAISW